MNDTLLQIDSLKKEAEALRPLKPEYERVFWDKFSLEFNYNSNHMEGNTLTYGHTQILLKTGNVVGKYNIRELQEMKAHDLALNVIRESAGDTEFSLSQKFIKEINQTILVEPFYNDAITPDGKKTQKLIIPGEYKKTPNSVLLQNGKMFDYPSPEETPSMMTDLMDWYEKETKAKELHPVLIAALFHYKLVCIHPFDDSNGRTSRLLMNYILLENGFAPLVIESSDKKNYLIALSEADAGNVGAFIKYIAKLALRWQKLYTNALKGENIEEEEDIDKQIQVLKKEFKSHNDKIEITFSKEALQFVFVTSIFPLINKIALDLSKLDDFFIKKNIHFAVRGNASGDCVSIDGLPVFFGQIIENPIEAPIDLSFTYDHIQLRKEEGLNFRYPNLITVTFSNYFYEVKSINLTTTNDIKKYYHQQLSSEEINSFSKEIVKKELLTIKNK